MPLLKSKVGRKSAEKIMHIPRSQGNPLRLKAAIKQAKDN